MHVSGPVWVSPQIPAARADQGGAGHQPENCQGPRADDPAITAGAGGSRDRIARAGRRAHPSVTDRLGRLLLITLEAARPDFDLCWQRLAPPSPIAPLSRCT